MLYETQPVATGAGARTDGESPDIRRLEQAAQWLDDAGALMVRVMEPMALHTTLQVGGPADLYVETDRLHLPQVLGVLTDARIPVFPLGRGSNLLVSDRGLRAAAVRLLGEPARFYDDEPVAVVGAGTSLPHLARQAAERGLAGLEPLAGVPGSVGGALVMNAGAYGTCIGDTVEEIEWIRWDGSVRHEDRAGLQFAYRDSQASRLDGVIASVTVRFERAAPEDVAQQLELYARRRRRTQPLDEPSAGCVFRNPPGGHAGRLIEQVGGKGLTHGSARVSDRHANFVISQPGASASDIAQLIEQVRELVRKRAGINLELEIQFVGEW